jgi:acetyl esterase/lipase
MGALLSAFVSYCPGVALGSEIADGAGLQDLADTPDGDWSFPPPDDENGFLGPDDISDRDPYCTEAPRVVPDHDNVKYKSFNRLAPDVGTTDLRFDQYNPPGTTGTFPAVVLVHGGGWWSGCKESISGLAETLSRDPDGLVVQHFFVFAIDYRLSCDRTTTPESSIKPYCGWTYRTIDPATLTRGPAIHDVQDGVRWVRTKWNTSPQFDSRWDGRVFLAGASAGGNLALTAAALSTEAVRNRPRAVAAWSGPSELQVMSNGQYGCSDPNSRYPADCWKRTNQYLGCKIEPHVDQACESPVNYYAESSAITVGNYDSADPPAFFANGGGGGALPELVALLEAIDFQVRLEGPLQFDPAEAVLCQVDASKHATGYLNLPYHCSDQPTDESVLQTTVNFLGDIS